MVRVLQAAGGSQIGDEENYNGWYIDGVSRDLRHPGVEALSSGVLHRWEFGGEEQLWGKGEKVMESEVPVHDFSPAGATASSPGVCASNPGKGAGLPRAAGRHYHHMDLCWQPMGASLGGALVLGGHC